MSKSELLDYAESLGITGLDGLTKAQIIEEVENHV
ncbi:MAG: Rho termination factor N-terminal domain-containing protein [Bacteroidales bacterium]|nr:Rho termination factor N-terminal domain-containing protein [Bacteroidales bacterium]